MGKYDLAHAKVLAKEVSPQNQTLNSDLPAIA
jgi:hypothetical protein